MDFDEQCLREALREASLRRGFCAPNPAVGAVIAKEGRVLARGHHRAAGEPHAEVEALKTLGDEARGATAYVTLEPCCHHGRTPPCSSLLIERKIARVVYAFGDPNRKVDGGGRRALQAAGIATEHRPLPDIDDFYRSYTYWTRTGLPFVTAKLAVSLDGKIAAPGGKPLRLTGADADSLTHRARRRSDAILTTVRTVLADDPQLSARGEETVAKPVYVLDRRAELPLTARLFETAARLTVLHDGTAPEARLRALAARGARPVPADGLSEAIAVIGRDGIHDLWVEAGGRLFTALARTPLLRRGMLYVTPKVLGPEALSAFAEPHDFPGDFREIRWQPAGADAVLTFER